MKNINFVTSVRWYITIEGRGGNYFMLNTNRRAFWPIHTSVNGQQQCLSVYDYTILSGEGNFSFAEFFTVDILP